jgi:putative membrane protein
MVDDMGWWTIPIVSLVIFTLYGIEGIGSQLEDPFGYDRNDINMDALVGDAKMEIDVVLQEWRKVVASVEGSLGGENSQGGTGESLSNGSTDGFARPDMFIRERARTAGGQ